MNRRDDCCDVYGKSRITLISVVNVRSEKKNCFYKLEVREEAQRLARARIDLMTKCLHYIYRNINLDAASVDVKEIS